MIPGSIARRYAKALFGLAIEKGRVEPWSDGLLALGKAVDASPELRDVLQNPAYTREARSAIVAQLARTIQLDPGPPELLQKLGDKASASGLSGVVDAIRETRAAVVTAVAQVVPLDAEPAALLQLLGERNRLGGLSAIAAAFRELADAELGRLRARVTSAVPLDDAAVLAIAEKLSAATKKKVLVERAVDPAILGGVVTQVGSVVYDGSLRTQLEDLRSTLKR